ncbi:hypothetical protein GLYMA_07G141750v4 [Glycine max]|nr:hypothetical protein GLYMA_07G141750v4 [Glycine max]KAH1086817.1 hypothetical protein GYH30_018373 [Glycine max]
MIYKDKHNDLQMGRSVRWDLSLIMQTGGFKMKLKNTL